jgi:Uma2 family endonuclease
MNTQLRSLMTVVREPTIRIPTSALTLEGFRAWVKSPEFPEQGMRASFLGGEVVIDTAPELFDTHNAIKTELYRVLSPLVRTLDTGRFVTDRMLFTNELAGISTEPDALFFTWEAWQSGRVRMEPSPAGQPNYEVVGRPDWVAEVVSDSSARKDLRDLRVKYHLAGIPEYWVIDARGDELLFEVLSHAAAEYQPREPTEGGWLRSAVFDREFRLTRERDRIGLWEYTLHVRS